MTPSKLPRLFPFLFATLLISGLWLAVGQAPAVPTAYAADTDIRINEIMASNSNTLQDENGDYSDWVELYNSGASSVNLNGWYLTDNAAVPTKWQLPNVTLNANSYLVIFASSKNRAVAGSELHTNFSLSAGGEYLGLRLPNGTTVIDEYAPSFPALGADVAYGVVFSGTRGFLSVPTPNATNDTAVPLVTISVPSGVFTAAFNVELSAPYLAPSDVIRYTTNGSEPTAASTLYTGPINIANSTRLRARVVRGGSLLGQTSYAAYIRVDNTVASFNSNLPIVIIEAFNQSISTGNDSTQVIAAIIDVGTGPLANRARVIDLPNYAGFAGIRRRGSSSGGFPKRQFSLDLWNDYTTQEIEASLLGMPSESDWILYAPGRYDRNMISNNFAHQLAKDMGLYGARTQFVEVYLNDNYATSSPPNANTALIDASDYDGIYVLMENMKRGEDRVDVQALETTDNAAPEITGGYIWTIDRSDFNEYAFRLTSSNNYPGNEPSGSSSWINITYPKADVLTIPQRDYFVSYMTEFAGVMTGPNAHNPVTGYPKYIDVDSWIDGYLLDVFVKDPDALRLSHFFSKPRYGKLYNDIAWDYDRTMGSTDGRDLDPCATISYIPTFNPAGDSGTLFNYWEQLLEDVDFYVRFADRWYDLRLNGPFNTTYMNPLVDGLAAQVSAEAYTREIARWDAPANSNYGPRNSNPNVCGFSMTLDTYQKEVDFFKWWLNRRMVWMDDTHLNLHPPTVSIVGSTAVITPAASAPVSSTLYYTLDGSDPRLPGGTLSPNAIAYSGPAALTQSTWVYARTYDPAQVVQRRWSAIGKAYYQASPAADFTNLVISEIQYDPQGSDDFEFIELTNIGSTRLDLTGVQIRTAISHTFGVGHLDPGEYLVLAQDFDAFQYRYSTPTSPWYYANIRYEEWASGSLDNQGETINILAANNAPILAFAYGTSGAWDGRANDRGSSHELSTPSAAPATLLADKNSYLADGDNWRPTSEYHGSPGRAGLGPDGRVVFNELLTHTDLPQVDSIELFNTTGGSLNLSHWVLSDSGDNYRHYTIPNTTNLAAGGFLVLDEGDFNVGGSQNPVPFALSSSEGETVYLLQADSTGNLLRFVDEVEFGPMANGVSLGRVPDGQGDLVRLCALTLGAANSPYCYGPVIINEIQYNPLGTDTNLEYIELYNTGMVTESLANWRLRGEVDYNFGVAHSLAPDQYLLLVGFDPSNTTLRDAFLATYDLVLGEVTLIGPWTGGQLNNGDGRITLQRPDNWQPLPAPGFFPMLTEDEVNYDDGNGWPVEPDGVGPSLELRSHLLDNRSPASWMPSYAPNGTPGRHNDDDNPYIHSGAGFLTPEGDSGTTPATFTVTLSYRSGMTVTVNYATQADTAVAGTDYLTTTGTLIFPPETISQTITVPILGNTRYEANRTFNVLLSDPVRGRMGTDTTSITIVENDSLPTLTLGDLSVSEGVGTAVFTASLSTASAFPITVDYATAEGTAAHGEDLTPISGTLTFPADSTSQTISVAIVDDNLDEPNEQFALQLSNINNATLGTSQATMTIADNDGLPAILSTPITVTEGLSGTWLLTLSHPTTFTITVAVATADGTGMADIDYQPISGTLTFAPLQTTSQPIVLTTLDNNVQDGDKTLALELANPTNATLGQPSVAATIADDEGEPVLTTPSTKFVVEGAEGETTLAPLTLTLSHPSGVTTTVAYTTAAGTAVGGVDYTPISGTIAFAPLQTTAVISVPILGNDVDDPNRTLTVTMTNPVGLELGTTAVELTILNDDGASSLAVDDVVVNEADGTATFSFLLVPASGQTVQVDFATADGTASAGADYEAISGTLTLSPGQTTAELDVTILDDAVYELEEAFALVLSNPVNVNLANFTATVTVMDNEPLPTFSVGGEEVWEGEMATFTVTLSAASDVTATVAYATAAGTALSGADYTPISDTLVFAPGQTSQLVQIPVLADGLYEPIEAFHLLLADPTHAGLATAEATATILDGDQAPLFSVVGETAVEGEMATFTVTLSAASGLTATVAYATADGTATAGDDYTAVSTLLTFAPGQTSQLVQIPVLADGLYEPTEAFHLLLADPTHAGLATAEATATILDGDEAPLVSVVGESLLEGDEGVVTATFTVTLAAVSGLTATVDFATADGTAMGGTDYEPISGTLTFAPGQTVQLVQVGVLGNTADQPNRTFQLGLSNLSHAQAGTITAEATIVDDDELVPPTGYAIFLPLIVR